MGRKIYHIKAPLVVILTTLQNLEIQNSQITKFSIEKNQIKIFDFWSNFKLIT